MAQLKRGSLNVQLLHSTMARPIQDALDAIQALVDQLGPLVDRAVNIYTSIEPFNFTTTTDTAANGTFTVPAYMPNHVHILLHLNGVLEWEWELVGPNDADSTLLRTKEPIPAGTQVSGLVIGLPRMQNVPSYVAHDSTLIGEGNESNPLGVNPSIPTNLNAIGGRTELNTFVYIPGPLGVDTNLRSENLLTGINSWNIVSIPKADNSQAGTIDALAYEKIFQNASDIEQLKNGASFFLAYTLEPRQLQTKLHCKRHMNPQREFLLEKFLLMEQL